MKDYKSMYYHLAGRMCITVEVLEMSSQSMQGTVSALESTVDALQENCKAINSLTEKIKATQLIMEKEFMSGDDEEINK